MADEVTKIVRGGSIGDNLTTSQIERTIAEINSTHKTVTTAHIGRKLGEIEAVRSGTGGSTNSAATRTATPKGK